MDLLRDVEARTRAFGLANEVRNTFVRLAALNEVDLPGLVPSCAEIRDRKDLDVCLPCLARTPPNTLTCGHRLCDTCVVHLPLKRCPLCSQINTVRFHPKPSGAGVRILHLGGDVADARAVALFLKELRGRISGCLPYHFDLVLCSGVGIFFALMLFCKNASIEDCMHLFDRLHHVKVRRRFIAPVLQDGMRDSDRPYQVKAWKSCFSFGPQLYFEMSDLHSSQAKMVLRFPERIIASYP